jgi:hypothetical protein
VVIRQDFFKAQEDSTRTKKCATEFIGHQESRHRLSPDDVAFATISLDHLWHRGD